MASDKIFTSAQTLLDFINLNEENETPKQISRYLRKQNNVAIDDGYSCKITVERRSSTRLKLRENYGPLVFYNYVDTDDVAKYLRYKKSKQRTSANENNIQSSLLNEKRLELVDAQLDITERFEMIMKANKIDASMYDFLWKDDRIEIYNTATSDIVYIIEINTFGRGTVSHTNSNMLTNNLDMFNCNELIVFAELVNAMTIIDYTTYMNIKIAIDILMRTSEIELPELDNKDEILNFLFNDDDIEFVHKDKLITISKKSRIKVEIHATSISNDLRLFRQSIKMKELDSQKLYNLIQKVAELS